MTPTPESLFEEGKAAAEVDSNQETTTECPYPQESWKARWWTRGYCYESRLLQLEEAQRELHSLKAAEEASTRSSIDGEVKAKAELYLFTIVAIDHNRRTKHIEPQLLLDVSPQSAAIHGLEGMKRKYPGCGDYQIGVVHKVPQDLIEDIKKLL